MAKRKYAELHKDRPWHDGSFSKWSKEFSWERPFRYDDGVTVTVSPVELAPWDNFTEETNASPDMPDDWGESVAEESPEKQDEADD